MAKTIVGLYDDHQEAKRAHETLIDHDFDRHKVHIIDESAGNKEDIVKRLLDSGVSEGDAQSYAEGVVRGGTLVLVKTDEDHVNEAVSLMNQFRPVDLDRRLEQWKSEGWRSSTVGRTGDRQTSILGGEGVSGQRTQDEDVLMGRSKESSSFGSPMSESERSASKQTGLGAKGQEEKFQVIEEEMRVGKSEVESGGVRAKTHVTEEPVSEKVTLREEKVNVERRPVDRDVSGFEGEAFKEEDIEFKEYREEPIVEKRARVIEEIVLTRDVSEHTETIEGTVRRQDVDIEHLRPEFESHFNRSFSGSDYSFDDYSKGYSYGSRLGSHPDFQGRSWQEVEPDARMQWEGTNKGTWENFKDSIRYGFDRMRGEERRDETQPGV
jgi:uncharacterized protein (TIGR02271 family)